MKHDMELHSWWVCLQTRFQTRGTHGRALSLEKAGALPITLMLSTPWGAAPRAAQNFAPVLLGPPQGLYLFLYWTLPYPETARSDTVHGVCRSGSVEAFKVFRMRASSPLRVPQFSHVRKITSSIVPCGLWFACRHQ